MTQAQKDLINFIITNNEYPVITLCSYDLFGLELDSIECYAHEKPVELNDILSNITSRFNIKGEMYTNYIIIYFHDEYSHEYTSIRINNPDGYEQ